MDYASMKKSELQAELVSRSIEFDSDATNAELRSLLVSNDEASDAIVDASPEDAPEAGKLFSVHCACPTPLAENPYQTRALSEKHAIARFFAVNGISGSDHPIIVTEVTASSAAAKPA